MFEVEKHVHIDVVVEHVRLLPHCMDGVLILPHPLYCEVCVYMNSKVTPHQPADGRLALNLPVIFVTLLESALPSDWC